MMKLVKQTLPQTQALQQVQFMRGQDQQQGQNETLLQKLLGYDEGQVYKDEETQIICVDVQGDFMVGGSLQLVGSESELNKKQNGDQPIPQQDYDKYLSDVNKFLYFQRKEHSQAEIVFSQDFHSQSRKHISFNSYNVQRGHPSTPQGVQFPVISNYDGRPRQYDQEMWPEHCVEGTWGQEIMQDVLTNEKVIKKGHDDELEEYSQFKRSFDKAKNFEMVNNNFSQYKAQYKEQANDDNQIWDRNQGVADSNTTQEQTKNGLHQHLQKENKVKNLIIFGLQTDVCVFNTQCDARQLGYNVFFVHDLSRQVRQQIRDSVSSEIPFFNEKNEYNNIGAVYIQEACCLSQVQNINLSEQKENEKNNILTEGRVTVDVQKQNTAQNEWLCKMGEKNKMAEKQKQDEEKANQEQKNKQDQIIQQLEAQQQEQEKSIQENKQQEVKQDFIYKIVFTVVVLALLSFNLVTFFVLKKQMKSQLEKQIGNAELGSVRGSNDSEDSSEGETDEEDQQVQIRQDPRFNRNDRVYSPQRSSFLGEETA